MRNKLTSELAICGFNAVAARAEYHPETINRLFLRKDRLPSFTKICKALAARKRPYKLCEDEELERICKTPHHQGVVAMILTPETPPLSQEELEAWAASGKTGLVLCGVGNDHNLGAIARAAAFFDAPWIIVQERQDWETAPVREAAPARENAPNRDAEDDRSGPPPVLTTSAFRVAEGGMEHVTVRTIRDPARFLRDASKKIVTIGTDSRSRLRAGDLPLVIREEGEKLGLRGKPAAALVLGNEETGLDDRVKAACSRMVRIPGTGLMDSLNVSGAAAVFLHRIFEG